MYRQRPRRDATHALLVWAINMLCLYIAGRFADDQLVYWATGVIATGLVLAISLVHDHGLLDLGLYPEHLRHDAAVMLCALVVELLVGVYLYGMPWGYALPKIVYYIVWIALQEEVVYRGFIQSYLFSLPVDRRLAYCMGALMFSLSHIPYQMQIRSWDVLFVVQLAMTFIMHLVFCWIVRRRGNICLPLAIHVAQDFLQVM